MTEFNQTANPVAAFWNEHKDEYMSRGEVKKSEIFDAYVAFCERNRKFAGTESDFHKKLKKVASDEGITIKDTRHRENGMQPYYCNFEGINVTETTESAQTDETIQQEHEQRQIECKYTHEQCQEDKTTAQNNITLDDVLNDKNLEIYI